jgi:hypothetical protein
MRLQNSKYFLEDVMKTIKKQALVLAILLLITFAASCTSTGEYKPLSKDETVIGTVQTTFTARSSAFFFKTKNSINVVNTQAYINLMEAAQRKYPGNIDVRDIVWATGRSVDHENTEVSASGKVVQLD